MQNKSELKDIKDISIDKTLPVSEKTMDYIRQIGNPYRYRVGNVKITAFFPSDAPKLADGYMRLKT